MNVDRNRAPIWQQIGAVFIFAWNLTTDVKVFGDPFSAFGKTALSVRWRDAKNKQLLSRARTLSQGAGYCNRR